MNATKWVLYDALSHQSPDDYPIRIESNITEYAGIHIYNANLKGLEPGTRYFFKFGTEGEWSAERSFATAPMESSHIRIVSGGIAEPIRMYGTSIHDYESV